MIDFVFALPIHNQLPKLPAEHRRVDSSIVYTIPPQKEKPLNTTLKRQSYIVKMKTLNTKFKKPKKTVRFSTKEQEEFGCNSDDNSSTNATTSSTTATTTRTSNSSISNEEIKKCWYDRSDLMRFRQKAIELALFEHKRSNGDDKSLPRGMEGMAMKRRKHKAVTLRYVLLAHKRGKDQDYVAALCAKLGYWNKEIAIHDACVDYYEVYQPSLVHLIPLVSSKPPTISLVPGAKSRNATGASSTTAAGSRSGSRSETESLSSPSSKKRGRYNNNNNNNNNNSSSSSGNTNGTSL